MNIIERNFYRLLRAGAFATEEAIEPMSAWKWNRLYQLAVMHDVIQVIYQGVQHCGDQFFLQVPETLMQQWKQSLSEEKSEENELLAADQLTNPVLNSKLQSMLDAEDSNVETRTALLHLLGVVRFIMNAGIPVKRITELGLYLRESGNRIDYIKLNTWTGKLKLGPMVQLVSIMLVKLLHFLPEELPFMQPISEEQMQRQLRDMLQQKNSHNEEWYFSQGKNIFVRTSNPSAMLWHVRRSIKYFRYYPSEMTTNFITSFAHSLSHIEE